MKSPDAVDCEMDNLEKIKDRRATTLKNCPGRYQGAYKRALLTKQSSKSIRGKCYECMGFEDLRNAVTDCRGYQCPLYFQRPFRYHDTDKVREIMIDHENVGGDEDSDGAET